MKYTLEIPRDDTLLSSHRTLRGAIRAQRARYRFVLRSGWDYVPDKIFFRGKRLTRRQEEIGLALGMLL